MSLINQSGRFFNGKFRQQIMIQRQSGTHSAEGFAVQYKTQQMTAIVVPCSPNDVLLLPEGERYLPSIKLYTQKPLNIGDLVTYRGQIYKIKTAANWGDYGYYNNIGVRHSQTANVDSTGFVVT